MKSHPLTFRERVVVGAVCWAVLLILISALMPNTIAAAWIYVFVSAVIVFRFVLVSKDPPESSGKQLGDSKASEPEETRVAFIDRMLTESEHEAQAIAAIRERNPEIAEEIHDLFRQKLAINSREDQP